MRKILLSAAFVLISSTAFAQTRTLSYDYLTDLPAVVATYTQSVTLDGVSVSGTVACVALGTTGTTCSIPVGVLTSGNHTIVVTVSLNGNTVQASKTGFNPADFPHTPGGLRIVITIVIP